MAILSSYMVPHPPLIVPAVGRGMQKDSVIIRAGDLQGRPLADVLLADLMEQSEETAQAALPDAA